jgi:hypothetical protein
MNSTANKVKRLCFKVSITIVADSKVDIQNALSRVAQDKDAHIIGQNLQVISVEEYSALTGLRPVMPEDVMK